MATQQLLFDIFARSQGVEKTFDSIVSSADSMESKLGPTGQRAAKALSSPILLGAAAGIGAAVVGMGSQFGQMAASAEQNAGAVETVFGGAAGKVEDYASRAANAVGLSASSYNELSAVTGTALKSAGVPFDQLAQKNDELITRGADLASVFGGTTAEAVGAMGAAFRGEFDSLERYGLTLTASAVETELAARGQDKLTGSALEAAKKQATMDLIMQQSAGSAGNFAKEADTAAGAQERQSAAFADAGAKLGEVLLPAMTTMASLATGMATWISENSGLVTGLAIGLGILAGVVGLLSAAITIMNIVMIPQIAVIGGIVLAVAALIAIIVLLVMNWDAVVSFLTTVWNGFISWFTGVMDGFFGWWNGVWAGFASWIVGLWSGFTGMLSGIWSGFVGFIQGIVSGFVGFLSAAFQGAVSFAVAVWSGLGSFFSGLWSGIISGVSGMIGNIGGFFSGLPGQIMGFFAGAGSWLYNAGRNIIDGLISGAGSLLRNIGGFFADMLPEMIRGPFKSALGIASPSKEFAGYGQNIGEGVLVGISRMQGRIDDRMASLVNVPELALTGGFGTGSQTGARTGQAGGGATIDDLIRAIQGQRPIQVIGAPGMDEDQLARATAEQIMWRG